MNNTATHASWMNLLEGLALPERKTGHPPRRVRLGPRPQRQDSRLHHRPERPSPPFVGTKTADQILNKANSKQISDAAR